MKNGKLVIVGGEKALLVSHMSSFSYVEAKDEIGTPFQALYIAAKRELGHPCPHLKTRKELLKMVSLISGARW